MVLKPLCTIINLMHNQIGFKDYEIIKHNNVDREDKLTIKTVKETIELTNIFTDIELIGLELTKHNYLNQEGVTGSFIEGIFEIVNYHDLIVLGDEFNQDTHTKLSIREESKSNREWLDNLVKAKRNIKVGEIELHPISQIKMSLDDHAPICNSAFYIFYSDDPIYPSNEMILEIYLKKDIYDLLSKYVENNLIDKIQITTGSERIFRPDRMLPEYKDEDRYILFNNEKYGSGTLLAYTGVHFETKKRINQENYKEDFEKKDEERERIIIKETKERNYENKFNFMIGLLIAIAIILFLK